MRWKKIGLMASVGILISIIIDVALPFEHPNHSRLYDYILSAILSISIWEGNLFIDRIFNKRYSWIHHTFRRTVLQLPASVFYSILLIYIGMWVYNKYVCILPTSMANTLFLIATIIGTLFSIILLAIEISITFLKQWKNSTLEMEKYKAESLQAQLQNLKSQVNPHFLFNNLSVLSSLVYKDQDKAVSFISQLSKVYRYILENNKQELITLENELSFINSYIFLLKIRFEDSIQININVDEKFLNKLIPPLSLQILLENTIKHNEASEDSPLVVMMFVEANYLVVSNNKQLRYTQEKTSGKGLENIKMRYSYFTNESVEISNDEKMFIVKIPLLLLNEGYNN